MARVLLAHPLFLVEHPDERASASPYFPLGVLYLAAYARERGHEVRIFDGTFEADRSSFDQALDDLRPDVVGVSCVLPLRPAAIDLARRARDRGAFVVAGGPDATAEPMLYLQGRFDAVVRHEGEQTLAAILDLADADGLTPSHLAIEPGLALYVDGRVICTGRRAPIENLDRLPEPARDLIDMDRYLDAWEADAGYRSLTVSVTRGCGRSGCNHCADAVHGDGFRQRSPSDVVAELARIQETFAVDRLRLVDDVDAMDREWFEAWSSEAERAGVALGFEALSDLERTDLPLLDVRDSL